MTFTNTGRSRLRRAMGGAIVLAAVGLLTLSACADDGAGPAGRHGQTSASPAVSASAAPRHNAADVAFAQGMIPHHRQALAMADLALSHASAAEVKNLAQDIKRAQDPEIRTMSGWLASWGAKVPDGDTPAMGSMNHPGHGAAGTMTAGELAELTKSTGKAFDMAFLTMMTKHHQGAVEMAKRERRAGAHQPAKDLARAVITAQTAEITRMNRLLSSN